MTLEEIKAKIAKGISVYWKTKDYEVILDKAGQYLIQYHHNDACIALTWSDGITLNGREQDFYPAC
jgi:ribosome-associated translation inhibitor RaiA